MKKQHFMEAIREDFQILDLPADESAISARRTRNLNSARIIPITDITPDPGQPRKTFDEEKLRELAESIKGKGVIQPITVRPGPNGTYVIIIGERRFRAAQLAGIQEMPCIIKDLDGQEVLILQMIENIQREDLSPVEEAKSYRTLLENNWTQTALANLIGKSQPYISQTLKILTLPETIVQEAGQPNISKEHLLQLTKADKPEQLWQEIKQGKTAREIQIQVEKEIHPKGRPKNYRYHYNPKGKPYRVTVEFKKTHAESEEIRAALNEALNNLTSTNPTSHN